jgi:hypothetical protein
VVAPYRVGGQPYAELPRVRLAAEKQEGEMSLWDQIFDKFNNRGGSILALTLFILFGIGLKNLIAFTGEDEINAGVYTSGFLFVGLMGWTSTYMGRVATKSTTYAQQLKDYETAVMRRRLEELSEEEILALCEECGVTEVELREVMDEAGSEADALTRKQKILEIFKMPQSEQDPRGALGF